MRKLLLSMSIAMFLFSSCASGRAGYTERRSSDRKSSDRVHSRKSSYRVRGTDEVGSLNARQHAALRAKTRGWQWPLKNVALTSKFGYRHGSFHDGVDLRAKSGTPIYATAPGKVIYSGSKISGYGKMIVLRHAGKLSTVYAHNSRLYVKVGQTVRRGQLIAASGNSGRSSGPHVHFEIREGVTAVNPAILMESPQRHNIAMARQAEQSRRVANAPDRVRTRAASTRRPAKTYRKPAARVVSAESGFKAREARKFN